MAVEKNETTSILCELKSRGYAPPALWYFLPPGLGHISIVPPCEVESPSVRPCVRPSVCPEPRNLLPLRAAEGGCK